MKRIIEHIYLIWYFLDVIIHIFKALQFYPANINNIFDICVQVQDQLGLH